MWLFSSVIFVFHSGAASSGPASGPASRSKSVGDKARSSDEDVAEDAAKDLRRRLDVREECRLADEEALEHAGEILPAGDDDDAVSALKPSKPFEHERNQEVTRCGIAVSVNLGLERLKAVPQNCSGFCVIVCGGNNGIIGLGRFGIEFLGGGGGGSCQDSYPPLLVSLQ